MEAVASEVANKAAESCFDWATTQINEGLSYIQKYNDNIEKLRIKRRELENLILEIEEQVKAGERELKKPTPTVIAWLEDAKIFLADDEWNDYMDEKKIREKVKCCFGLLNWNLKYRYLVSKRAKKKSKITEEKIKKMEDYGSRAITLPGEPLKLGSMPTAYSKSLASRESTLKEIMEALKDKKVGVIGIYGMGGVGKTTLIEEIAKRAEADGSFSEVVIVDVSQAPNVSKMQQQIAERIGLPLQGYNIEAERALMIHKRLNHKERGNQMSKKGGKQAFVILDNIWNKLDLNKVGIPKDCKIALTTRNQYVCSEMGANKKFELQGLNDTEAMELFLERAGHLPDHDNGCKSVADKLVKKCGGLPLAIVALANTLRDRNLSDWQHAAAQLGSSVSARVGGTMEENVYPIIEWSYNFISSKEKKKFFLLCCLFPLGSSIAIQDLMRYGAGLGLFQYMNSLGEAIEQAYSWAAELKSSSLLLKAKDEHHVNIHDAVRETSMSIAVKGENIFHVGSFSRWLLKETFQTYTAISMMSEDSHEPLSWFEFPKLKMLLLKRSQPFGKFPDNFFQGMKSLKVLVISGMEFQTLPSSITQLKNLRTLHLECCVLSDISVIASLVDLLFLSLRESKIRKLPRELENLGKLKLLDLTECEPFRIIPAGVIARLTNLEGLYISHSFNVGRKTYFDIFSLSAEEFIRDDEKKVSLLELNSLPYLDVLEMHVPSINLLPDNLVFHHLSRFSISISNEIPFQHRRRVSSIFSSLFSKNIDNKCHHHSKLLSLRLIDAGRPLQQCITFLLKEAEHLSLEIISGLKNVVDSLDKDGFRNLKCLLVEECSGMEYIVTANELNEDGGAFPKLETLTVNRKMDSLKVICHGPPSHYSFHHLKKLKLFSLKCLQTFWGDQDQDSNQPFFNEKMKFSSLEELKIERVDGIVELWNLADVEEEVAAFPRLVNLTLTNLPELRSVWRSKDIVIHRNFRSLKSLKVSVCPKLEILCPFFVAETFEQLETLNVHENNNIKEIIAKKTEELKNNDTGMTIFPKLRDMELLRLPNLKCFFGGSIKLVFPSLESINFSDLGKMVTFVYSEYPRDSDALFNDKVALPAIKEIYMRDVNGPKEIWGSHLDSGSFNKLESLMVINGKKDTKVFSLDTIKQMRNLKELDLKDFRLAEELIERIGFYNDGVENSTLLLPQLGKLTIGLFPLLKRIPWKDLAFQNLRYLKIFKVEGLTSLFPASVGRRLENLEELDVSSCQMMEEIVGGESGDTNTVEVNVVFPHLNILRLCDLPALRSLNSDNVIIEFPSIIEAAFVGSQKSIPLDLLQKLHHVKELELEGCEIPLVLYDLEGRASTILPRLGKLTLSKMHKLQMIPWKIFPNENLHYLKIYHIDGLKFLFPASLGIKEFAQLEEIDIWSCKDIEQVLAQESTDDTFNNVASTTIVFPRVKIIKLQFLQGLRSFSSENYKDLQFPSLEEVQIDSCPMMEAFSYGSLSTPKLRKIRINWIVEKENLDLNTVIKKRMEERKRKEEMFQLIWRREHTSGEGTKTEITEGETSQRIKEEMSERDTGTKSTEGQTSQRIEEETSGEGTKTESTEGETSQRIEEEMSGKDIQTKGTEGQTSQRIEEETSGEGTKTESTEGETSQRIEEMSWKDTETKGTEGQTSQREEKTSGEGTKTESTEGETSQRIEKEMSGKDTKTKSIEGETSRRYHLTIQDQIFKQTDRRDKYGRHKNRKHRRRDKSTNRRRDEWERRRNKEHRRKDKSADRRDKWGRHKNRKHRRDESTNKRRDEWERHKNKKHRRRDKSADRKRDNAERQRKKIHRRRDKSRDRRRDNVRRCRNRIHKMRDKSRDRRRDNVGKCRNRIHRMRDKWRRHEIRKLVLEWQK